MRIRFLSDLHIEFGNIRKGLIQPCGEDVVVLAGDIGVGADGAVWARKAFPDVPVLYVLGNHELYHQRLDTLADEIREACQGSNVRLLDNEAAVIGGVRFLGSTLWTDFQLHGTPADSMELAQRRINDFRLIRTGDRERQILRAEGTVAMHDRSRQWLESEIAASPEPVVVISHHAPLQDGTSAPKYRYDGLAPTFASNLAPLMVPKVRAWIFGHTHWCADFEFNGVRILSNQLGYPHEALESFSFTRYLEIDGAGMVSTGQI